MKAKIFIMAFKDLVLFHSEDKPTFPELTGWDSESSINLVLNPCSLLASQLEHGIRALVWDAERIPEANPQAFSFSLKVTYMNKISLFHKSAYKLWQNQYEASQIQKCKVKIKSRGKKNKMKLNIWWMLTETDLG